MEPVFEATVSSALLAHLDGFATNASAPTSNDGRGPDEAADEPPLPARDEVVSSVAPVGFRRMALRQDGRRPMLLDAMLVWEKSLSVSPRSDPSMKMTQHVQLLVDRHRALFAHIKTEPPPDAPARPCFLAEPIHMADDLTRLIKACSPDRCLPAAQDLDRPAEAARSSADHDVPMRPI